MDDITKNYIDYRWAGKPRPEWNERPMEMTEKPYGWEVTIDKRVAGKANEQVTYHWRGCSEASARKKAMMKTGAIRVVKVEAVDQETWFRAYGAPGRM